MDPKIEELKSRVHEVHDLRSAAAVLSWDQETYMPPGGASARADQMTTLRRLAHQKLVSEEMGQLLEELKPQTAQMPDDSFEASLVRVVWDMFEREVKVPTELVAEMSRAASEGHAVWVEARRENDFERFRPALEKLVALTIRYAECFKPYDSVYEPLLDQSEPGMKTSELRKIFEALKVEIVPLRKAIASRAETVDDRVLHRHYSEDQQWAFGLEVARAFGYDLRRGRQDRSAHPFTIGFSVDDVRITTRLDPDFLPMALFGTLHETGHALYMQGHDPVLGRTPLANGASSGLHESQSRMWENLVG
ncbi:MAG: carboxypeptidase M32, partial [Chloroflexi bacterium]|nr:carboxypeptidase M32 [Chloroflexota bacterium]